jgi:hypothetical protein
VGFLIFLFLVFIAAPMMASLVSNLKKKPPTPGQINSTFATVVRKEKICPPHKWFSQEIRDAAGNKLYDRLVCEHCGPLKSQGENYE